MTTWAAPCAIAGAQTTAAEAAAATASIKSRRLNCLTRMAWMATSYRCAWYHSAMASISMSEKPLAIRSITVALRWPDRNARICATMSSALRPTSGGTLVSTTELGGWQPEQAAAPAGGSEEFRRSRGNGHHDDCGGNESAKQVHGPYLPRERPATSASPLRVHANCML